MRRCVTAISCCLFLLFCACAPSLPYDPYQGLTQEEWQTLQEQKAAYEALSALEQKVARESGMGCPHFVHLFWEEAIDIRLMRHVGEDAANEWFNARLAQGECADIYSFARHFGMDFDTLAAFIAENDMTELYPPDKIKARYAYWGE